MDKKIISIYMGNPDNSNHAELELPATPWEMVDAMDRLRLSEGQEPYWQVEDMGRYEFLAPHLDGYDLYQFNALAEKLRTFSDVDAVAFEGLVQMELNNLYQNNGGDLTLRRVLDLAYSVDCCHVVPGITDDAALGQFYVENDFLPDLATVPDSVLEMLDYEAKIFDLLSALLEWNDLTLSTPAVACISAKDQEALQSLKHFLRQNYSAQVDLPRLAQMCYMSKSKLTYLFRMLYGTTIYEFVLACRIDRAKELLADQEKKISEIATLVGYERQSSFSAAFHQRTGITPNEFRRQLGN